MCAARFKPPYQGAFAPPIPGYLPPPKTSALASLLANGGVDLEPDVPEADRPAVAWMNTAGYLHVGYSNGIEIRLEEYGKQTPGGWHVDHILPLELGGRSNRSNLRARQWRDNVSAGGSLASLLKSLEPKDR